MASNTPTFTLRIDQELLKKIHYLAEVNGRSANKEIEQIIKAYIANFEKENGVISV